MRIWTLGGLCVALALATLVGFACGSDGGSNGGTETPEAATPRVLPEPTITGNRYTFPGRGYAVDIPEGWTTDPNSVAAGSLVVDSFFSSEEVDGVQTNITVSCEENPTVSTSEYVEQRLETIRQLDARDLERSGTLEVAGVPAEMVQYSLVREDVTVGKVDVMFVSGPCAWTISLTAAPSALDAAKATLNAFLSSFTILQE
ncbi:MAG TPA: hypothetical protein VNM43_11280 [Dehalococcoidia bacterium]|nr:hypothetical protein [Dehalococcoidia bacterium]